MKSWTTPTHAQVDKTIALLAYPEQRRYFFDRLENPLWLEPLQKKGFFRNPISVTRDEGKKTVGFPPWPESRYLARMASHAPAKVLEIALLIETDNIRVQEDLVDVALAMPAETAVNLAPKVLSWLASPYSSIWPEKFGDLVSHFAKGNQVEAALALARRLLEVLPGQGKLSEARARFDAWHYERILEKNIPELSATAGVKALALLCELLDSAVHLSVEGGTEEGGEDYSFIWRRTIESKKPRGFHEFRDLLVSAVRDAAIKLVETDRSLISAVIEELEHRSWKIFRRIVLHILRFIPDSGPDLVHQRLVDRTLFEDRGIQREYALLLRDRFGSLPMNNRIEILTWIEQGPDLDEFREDSRAWGSNPPTGEELETYGKRWRMKRLRWIRDSLPSEWKQQYGALVQEFGEPEDPEFVPSSEAVWVGPKSPKGEEELRAMPASDVIAYMKEWRPSKETGPRGSSIEGLGRQLRSLVASKPSSFVQEVLNFRGLDPTYVRALLEGLHEAVSKEPFNWQPLIEFCVWITTQPRGIEGRVLQKWDADQDWGPTRATLGRLLSAGLKEGESAIPLSLREQVWKILRELTNDPDPTPQYEKEFGGKNMDPVAMSINTVRGEAMHTVMRYALWLRRNIAMAEHAQNRLARGFGEMPEVRKVLEGHLDTSHDPSLAIRAVYGEWFPWLVLLDSRWATDNLNRIFPDDEDKRDLRDAAWEAYILFCQPYDITFDVLKEEYLRAVERIGTTATDKRHHGDPDRQLAEHLMVFYWRRKSDLNERGGLLERFYAKASDTLRAHALEFVGRSLINTEGAVEAEALEPLRSIWLVRFDVARRATNLAPYIEELSAFGWWFASGKFDDSWAVEQLIGTLSLTRRIDADWLVLEKLTRLAEAMPKEVVRCVSLMIEGDLEVWTIHGWLKELRAILSKIIRSSDRIARQAAVEVVNRLGTKGFLEFRDLLKFGNDS